MLKHFYEHVSLLKKQIFFRHLDFRFCIDTVRYSKIDYYLFIVSFRRRTNPRVHHFYAMTKVSDVNECTDEQLEEKMQLHAREFYKFLKRRFPQAA